MPCEEQVNPPCPNQNCTGRIERYEYKETDIRHISEQCTSCDYRYTYTIGPIDPSMLVKIDWPE